MNPVLLGAGLVLLLLVGVDVVATTTASGSAGGSGPPTTRVAKLVWTGALRIHRQRTSHRGLHLVGLAIISGVIAAWIIGIWLAWTMILASADGAVVDPKTGAAADLVGTAYFAGYAVLTLGNGELVPSSDTWRMVTLAATATGLGLVTLAVTYLLNIVQAGNRRRSLASTIWTLGDTDADILRRASVDPDGFTQQLWSLVDPLVIVREQHVTFPVLHFLHSTDRHRALPAQVAKLAAALEQIGTDSAVAPSVVASARRAIDEYVEAVRDYEPGDGPGRPSRALLGAGGWLTDS